MQLIHHVLFVALLQTVLLNPPLAFAVSTSNQDDEQMAEITGYHRVAGQPAEDVHHFSLSSDGSQIALLALHEPSRRDRLWICDVTGTESKVMDFEDGKMRGSAFWFNQDREVLTVLQNLKGKKILRAVNSKTGTHRDHLTVERDQLKDFSVSKWDSKIVIWDARGSLSLVGETGEVSHLYGPLEENESFVTYSWLPGGKKGAFLVQEQKSPTMELFTIDFGTKEIRESRQLWRLPGDFYRLHGVNLSWAQDGRLFWSGFFSTDLENPGHGHAIFLISKNGWSVRDIYTPNPAAYANWDDSHGKVFFLMDRLTEPMSNAYGNVYWVDLKDVEFAR